MIDELQLKLCDIQGRLFELSGEKQLPSAAFIRAFMTSDVARELDSRYNRAQWMGEEYLLEETCSGAKKLFGAGDVYDRDTLYWIGYVYRYWHFYTGESSTKILRQAPVDTMKRNYMMFHTMDPSLAVEKLKEISITASRGSDRTRPARQTPHRL
ncbi:MAG: hypothetical protein J6V14_05135 [Clostridia bacterium]|nr:hypothetical protein [Clostridia bacterium]